jgi:enoyl-CoA hydratase
MIRTTVVERVTLLTVDRPERRNALDLDHCVALHRAVDEAVAAGARALVVTGEGTAFCSGADLGGVYGEAFREALYGMLGAITAAPVPVIAAINGPAIGAGTQLAIAADLRIAGPTARFGVPTAKLGLAVDFWTVRRLALLAGGGPARALLLACDELDLDAAERAGLVQRRGDLDDALAWAAYLAGLAPLTLAYNKLALEQALEADGPDDATLAAFERCWASDDFAEGRAAGAERRPPRFQGR